MKRRIIGASNGKSGRKVRAPVHLRFLQRATKDPNGPPVASLWELEHGKSLLETPLVSPECRMIQNSWSVTCGRLDLAYGTSFSLEKAAATERKRIEHFQAYPVLARLQTLADQTRNADPLNLRAWLPFLPYARYNVEAFLRLKDIPRADLVIAGELRPARASILSVEEARKLGVPEFAYGQVFTNAKLNDAAATELKLFIVIRGECSSLVQALALGHELVHFHQLEEETAFFPGEQAAFNVVTPSVENVANIRFVESLGIRLPFSIAGWLPPR